MVSLVQYLHLCICASASASASAYACDPVSASPSASASASAWWWLKARASSRYLAGAGRAYWRQHARRSPTHGCPRPPHAARAGRNSWRHGQRLDLPGLGGGTPVPGRSRE
eukprot:1101200-Lingulodinium_polyedra.AAC.1